MSEHVPTVRELAAVGRDYAYATDWRKGERKNDPKIPTRWHVTVEGHAVMGEAMRANALEVIARGEGEWVRPPSRQDIARGE